MVMEFTTKEELDLWEKTRNWCYKKYEGDRTYLILKDNAPEDCKDFFNKYFAKKSS